ncbi:MAG: hypothetical protein M3198_20050 [Actinomycetota bacterium]|nr:hypothetical protein [Actinomycetota bacterium]
MKTKISAGIAAILLVALSASTAGAHLRSHADGNDVRSRLDIRSVDLSNGRQSFVIDVRTYERFALNDLYSGMGFLLKVDSRGDKRHDFIVDMSTYESSYPYCNIYDRNGFSRGGAEADKDPRGMTCVFASDPFNQTKHIRWVMTSSHSGRTDRAPDAGWFRH